jgi:hypothetical protein
MTTQAEQTISVSAVRRRARRLRTLIPSIVIAVLVTACSDIDAPATPTLLAAIEQGAVADVTTADLDPTGDADADGVANERQLPAGSHLGPSGQ